MSRAGFLVVNALLSSSWLIAQSPPRFEVASIKVHQSNSPDHAPAGISGNRFVIGGNVNQLVIYAYGLKRYQVRGGPEWVVNPALDRDYFDIEAVASNDEPLTPERARLMLQTLLAGRFKLAVHKESPSMPVYALVVHRGGPKLKESSADAVRNSRGSVNATTVTATFTRSPIDSLVQILSGAADRPIIDRTGLTGYYDFKLEFARDPAATTADSTVPSVYTAVQEQLGLRLESQNAPIDVVVIDRAERPSDN